MRVAQRRKLCRSELPANDVMSRFNAPRPFLLLLLVSISRHHDAFVSNFTTAKASNNNFVTAREAIHLAFRASRLRSGVLEGEPRDPRRQGRHAVTIAALGTRFDAFSRGKLACETLESRRSSSPLHTHNPGQVTSTLPVSRIGIECLTEGRYGPMVGGVERWRGIGDFTSYSARA
ncbi:hypothetical protein EVAR_36842_1 [Eumeta japonica]|uniref:Uncharacterized protein n=1 Tax=Eumeta variegata TaxID=151549 RepID=A0A4C1WAJ7_EUMVA|nr:hypothetical protein EVAR_36842_1 [Eumeta japonica]